MHVAIPVRLLFKVDPNRHTIAIAGKFEKPIDLSSSINSFVGQSKHAAFSSMVGAVRKYVDQIVRIHDNMVKLSDFTLVYSTQVVGDDGSFYSHPGIVSEIQL